MSNLPVPQQEPSSRKGHVPVRLKVQDDKGFEKTILFRKILLRVGRDPGSDLRIDHSSIAPCHLIIMREGGRHHFTDTSDGAGIEVNGSKVLKGELQHGDRITFGAGCPYEATFLVEGIRADDEKDRNLRTLLAAIRTINSSLVLEQVLEKVMDAVMEVTQAGKGFLMLVDASGELRAKVARNIDRDALDQEVIPASRSVIDEVCRTSKPVSLLVDGNAVPRSHSIIRLDLKAIMCVPILSPERLIGVIYVDHEQKVLESSMSKVDILKALADYASIAIGNAKLTERMMVAERVSTVGRMVSSIVHDLRSPLAGIRAAAQLLQEDPTTSKGPRLTSMIMSEVDRMSGMAQEVLDYCRGKMEVQAAIVDLGKLVESIMEPLRDLLEARSIHLNLNLDEGVEAPADSERLGRVLRNLVDNAADAMPDGGVLTLTVRREEGRASLLVSDTGSGMSEEVKRRMFEPFFTHGKKRGNGLGMAIAQRIIEAHNGSFEIESSVGEGTTISLLLPLETGTAARPRSDAAGSLVSAP